MQNTTATATTMERREFKETRQPVPFFFFLITEKSSTVNGTRFGTW